MFENNETIDKAEEKIIFKRFFFVFIIIFTVYYIEYFTSPSNINRYIFTQYLVSYNLGFISRGLVGSILTLIFKNYTVHHIYSFITITNFVLIIMTSYFTAKVISKSNKKIREIVIVIAFFFIVNPSGLTYLFHFRNFGRLEIFSFILFFISIFVLFKNNNLVYLIPIISILNIMIYQTAIFLYLPIIIIIIFYIAIKDRSKKHMIIFIITACFSIMAFLYIQIWGKITSIPYEEIVSIMWQKTDFEPSKGFLYAEFYMEIAGHLGLMAIHLEKMIPLFLIALMVYIPIFIFIYYIYINILIKSVKREKLAYFFIIANILTFIPVFVFAVDYGRWISAYFTMQITLILSLIYFKDKYVLSILNLLSPKFQKTKYIVYTVIFAYALMGRMKTFEIFEFSHKIQEIFEAIKFYIQILIN